MTKIYPPSVLITGGAVRIGRVIALHLASLGWQVAVHYHRSADEAAETVKAIESLGVKAIAIQGDVSGDSGGMIIRKAVQEMGSPITALVNNAAAFGKDSLEDFTHDGWQRHMDTNLYAPLVLTRAFVKQLPEDARGAIVNIIDGCEDMCLSPNFLTYSLSKYGLAEATRLLAQQLAPAIRVNGVSPGLTLPKEGEEEMFARLVSKLPLKHATEPENIAEAVAYLLSAGSITGQILALNGGATVRKRF